MSDFAKRVIRWQQRHGRHDLPWQGTRDPYRIWLSEVMLQQTQVATVLPYYQRFLDHYADVEALAAATEGEVLRLWSGLGYYARARNLHRAARTVADCGSFPGSAAAIAELPGLGRSSAAAIAVFAYGERAAILDGNVKRVLARAFAVEGFPGEASVTRTLWELAESLLPPSRIEAYTQGLMDLGATVCTRGTPRCPECPLAQACIARRDGREAELPTARKSKPLPLRRARWLVLQRAGKILLERRPASGVWGGLLAFPEIDDRGTAAACLRLAGERPPRVKRLPLVEHGFSHFRLQARPVLCDLPPQSPARAEQSGALWLAPRQAMDEAIPAPVRRVLASLLVSFPGETAASGPAKRRRVSAARGRSRVRGDPA